MASTDVWPAIHAERRALAADLEPLTEPQWATPSLCSGWSVRDVLAHMTAAAKFTAPKFFAALVASGLRFTSVNTKGVSLNLGGSPADTLAAFKGEVTSTTHPPGPNETWLGEVVVHSADIRRPLGIVRDYPTDVLVTVADFYKGSNLLIGAKKRIAGLTLRAADADWTTGSGPEVTGPLLSLVQAMTGRRPALDDLSGDGLATLRARG